MVSTVEAVKPSLPLVLRSSSCRLSIVLIGRLCCGLLLGALTDLFPKYLSSCCAHAYSSEHWLQTKAYSLLSKLGECCLPLYNGTFSIRHLRSEFTFTNGIQSVVAMKSLH